MKKLLLILFFFPFVVTSKGQHLSAKERDSLLSLYSPEKKDTQQVWILSSLSLHYIFNNPDSGLLLAKKELELAQSLNYERGITDAKPRLAIYWWAVGEYPLAIKLFTENIEYYRSINDITGIALQTGLMFNVHRDQGDYEAAFADLRFSDSVNQIVNSCKGCVDSVSLGSVFYEMKQYDSALFYLKNIEQPGKGWNLLMLGKTYAKLGNDSLALKYYINSIYRLIDENNIKGLADAYNSLAALFNKMNKNDSAITYAQKGLELLKQKKFNREILQSYLTLSDIYNANDPKLALSYLRLAFAANDTLYNQEKQRQISGYKFNDELNQAQLQNQLEQSQLKYRNRLNIYILLAGLLILIIIAGGLWRRNVYKQKSYALLQKQKQETDFQKTKVEKTLEELKSTQAQLIQSEKMASLGELTAGIAHEIQNPLNFVNNFSEVNRELIAEMKEEIDKGNYDEVKLLANDVEENEGKINHHGKRADAIVKGMLQHSRSSTGAKEPTDINKFADEYLRLSYHGMRAKDKTFNANMQTDFDASIGRINIIPQDIGRVLLNLYNNAFYAVTEKTKQQPNGYEPTISVSSKKVNNKVELTVKDNGNGIPQKVIDKIFQPFFTTKPTGEGTGLGLSLSYDIIKAHGGEIKVETKEGEGSEFIIQLP